MKYYEIKVTHQDNTGQHSFNNRYYRSTPEDAIACYSEVEKNAETNESIHSIHLLEVDELKKWIRPTSSS